MNAQCTSPKDENWKLHGVHPQLNGYHNRAMEMNKLRRQASNTWEGLHRRGAEHKKPHTKENTLLGSDHIKYKKQEKPADPEEV